MVRDVISCDCLERISGSLPQDRLDACEYEVVSETRLDGMARLEIRYSVDETLEVPATVLLPDRRSFRTAVLALHQTTIPEALGRREVVGPGGREDMHYGRELAMRGFAVIAPDYPLFGDYEIDWRRIYDEFGYESVTAKGIANHVVAMNVCAAMTEEPQCDFVSIGHSLGGSNSLFVGAQDPRVVASVSSAGFGSFHTYAEASKTGDLTGWARADKYMPLIESRFGLSADRLGFDFDEILACHNTGKLFLNVPVLDDVFPFARQKEIILRARERLRDRGIDGSVEAHFPEVGHAFPNAVRASAYEFIEKHATRA